MSFTRNNADLVTRAAVGLRMVTETLGLPSGDDEAAAFEGVKQTVAALLDDFTTQRAATALTTQNWTTELASATRTATADGPDRVNTTARGLVAVLDLTAFVTAASVQLLIQRKNAAGTYTTIVTGVALTAVGRAILLLDPLAGTEVAGVDDSVSAGLPHEYRVRVVQGNANDHTYSVASYAIR
jgi:hypothetical protein